MKDQVKTQEQLLKELDSLRETNRFLQNILKSSSAISIVSTDLDGNILYWNIGAENILGYKAEEIVGRHNISILYPDEGNTKKTVEEVRSFVFSNKEGTSCEIEEITKDGRRIWVDLTLTPRFDENGEVVGILGIGQDITERKRLGEHLLQAQKMEAIGRLAGGIAHDFNNLLTTIKGYSELLRYRFGANDSLCKDLERIEQAADQATSLTRQVLAFSRKQMLRPQVLDLNAMSANRDKMLRPFVGEDIELVTVLAPKHRLVEVDLVQIEQVILNLAVNARDAMPKGGKLTIKVENVTLDEEACKVIPEARPGAFARISVEDTGVGMHEAILDQIFEPFFSTKGPGVGTGLGLSAVYGIVKQHEGWINVYSEPGKGSTFKVYLPACSAEQEEERKDTLPLGELRGRGERILAVEDQKEVREFTTQVLGENGYVVFEAATAKEALEIFERENGAFHLVFSDVVLPDRSGLELVEELRARKGELGVVLSSGYTGERSHRQKIHERGFRFLQKPYALPDLFRILREAIEQAR